MPNCNTYEMPTAGQPVRWLQLKVVAAETAISRRTLNRWARLGYIVADRLGSGHGEWLIALNARGLPISTKPFRAGSASSGDTAP